MNNYIVVGGQYTYNVYGSKDSLRAAKQLASKHEEYWGNWQGWHTPNIYRAEDCTEEGYPEPWAYPVAVKRNGRWTEDV